jgi:tetratricopeptide (TPR) repeat protein
VVLTLEDATVQVDSRSPWILAAPAASVRWDGVATLSASTGSFDAPEGRYEALRDDARLRGRFQAALAPEVVHGQVGTRLVLSGDVEETTLPLSAAAAQAWFPPESPRFAHLVVGVMVGLGASVGAGAYLASRRRPRAPALSLTVEDCMAAATKAADEEDWERAIQWLRRVRAMAPTSARTCADLAHALCQTGRKDEALHTYEEASRLAHDGEADFNGAVVAAEAGRPPHEVESWLERALDRTPMYVVDVDSDPVFQGLRGRARFERIVADAWTRMDDVDDDALVR